MDDVTVLLILDITNGGSSQLRNVMSEQNADASSGGPRRRTLLRGVAAAGIGAAIGTGSGLVGGSDHNPQARCNCPSAWVKYEFDDEDCVFVYEEDEDSDDVVTIMYDSEDEEQNKDEGCEPIAFDYEVGEGWRITHICVEGGGDSVGRGNVNVGPEDTATFNTDDGESGPAISNVVFCLEEDRETFTGYQIDLIEGPVIANLGPDNKYCDREDLLQAKWQDGNFDVQCPECWDGSDCEATIDQDVTIENGTATACINESEAQNYALVVYGTPGTSWDESTAGQQVLVDSDTEPDENGCFQVTLPPTSST